MGLRLGFHYHIPARRQAGRIVMTGYLGCFVDSLAEHCEHVTCFLHSPGQRDHFTGDYAIRSGNVSLVDIGPHGSVPARILAARHHTRSVQLRRHELDLLLLRGPSPLLPAFARAAGDLPIALLLVGDYLAGVDDLPQPIWRKELIRLWSRWNQARQLAATRRSLTFVNSHLLYDQLLGHAPHLVETRTTTLSRADFFSREDTCQAPPYRLLYTGRMVRAKGLLEIVSALASLAAQGYDCVLDLVGMPVPGDPILSELQHSAAELGIQRRVAYHGYRPLGPQLFEFYRRADIFLMASTSSFEGFPRAIWEAMAHSLPVIATRVGSIPDYLNGVAELVEPGSPEALARAVVCLLSQPELRRKHIRAGWRLAQENTLERRTSELIRQIEAFLQQKNNE